MKAIAVKTTIDANETRTIRYFLNLCIIPSFLCVYWCIFLICQAVKRSRVKSRMRTQQTLQRVNQLKTENDMLEEKIKLLSKELGFLKELFMAQAGKI